MDKINMNMVLQRENLKINPRVALQEFEANKKDIKYTRGFYVHGKTGVGKTYFVKQLLKEIGYDVVLYDSSNLRNKSIIKTISQHNMSDTNVLLMTKKKQYCNYYG